MKKWAVGFYSLFDNVLTVEIVSANSWQDAIKLHSKVSEYEYPTDDLEAAKQEFFNCDAGIDVVEII